MVKVNDPCVYKLQRLLFNENGRRKPCVTDIQGAEPRSLLPYELSNGLRCIAFCVIHL